MRPIVGAYPVTPGQAIDRLLDWYDRHRRPLPWRAAPGRRPDPYHVLLSEVMLQQTTVATVAGRYEAFLARFPSLTALAAAAPADVLHAWQGLGYYRRARALHACAEAVALRFDGALPRSEGALRELPGIGAYTARAILAIAFDQPTVPVDANIARVLARRHGIETPLPGALKELQAQADALASLRRPGDVAQALMDLGATVCRPRLPRCEACPWQSACIAHAAGSAARLPRRAARPRAAGAAWPRLPPDPAGRRDPVPAPAGERPARRPARIAGQPLAGGPAAACRPRSSMRRSRPTGGWRASR